MDISYDDIQAKLANIKKQEGENEGATFEELEKEPDSFSLEGSDSYGKEEEPTEEEKEIVEGEKEEEPETPEEIKPQVPTEGDELIEQLLTLADKEAVLKSKGQEIKLKDIPREEIVNYFQKGYRFYQEMDNLSKTKRQLEQERKTLDLGAAQVVNMLKERGGMAEGAVRTDPTQLAALQPNEMDTDEVRALKQTVLSLNDSVNQLKGRTESSEYMVRQNAFLGELDKFKEDYPLMSKDEVIAIKSLDPDTSTEDIARASHQYHGSDTYFDAVLKARPEKLRELEEKAVKKFLAQKAKASSGSRSKASTTVSSKVTSAVKPKIRSFDDIETHRDELISTLEKIRESAE